jgi:ankyrin repeat protein
MNKRIIACGIASLMMLSSFESYHIFKENKSSIRAYAEDDPGTIYDAAKNGDLGVIEEFSQNYEKIFEADDRRRNILHWAVIGHQIEVFNFILNSFGHGDKREDVLEMLEAVDENLLSPWHYAMLGAAHTEGEVQREYIELARRIFDEIKMAGIDSVVQLRALKGEIIDEKDAKQCDNIFYQTPLHLAAINGNIDSIAPILDKVRSIDEIEDDPFERLDIDARDRFGDTPLMLAIRHGNIGAFNFYLSHGANVNISDFNGKTPLKLAIQKQRKEMVRLLLENGADTNQTGCNYKLTDIVIRRWSLDEENWLETSFNKDLVADKWDNIKFIESIINRTLFDRNHTILEVTQFVPLGMAVLRGDVDSVRLLINAGADFGALGSGTAFYLASKTENREMYNLLLGYRLHINDALNEAIRQDSVTLAELILSEGTIKPNDVFYY